MISSLTRSTRWSAQQKPQSALSRRELSFATQDLEVNRCSPSDAGVTPPLRLGDAATDFGARNGGRSATPQSGIEATVLAGCSLRTMAVNAVLPTLVNSAVYLSDEDPELVRNLLPFLLKTIESIIEADPARQDVLLFANTGFVLYANAFLQADAALAEWDDYDLALELNERALRMYLRACDYGLRNVEVDHPGITARLQSDPETAVAVFGREDVESLYYLGGAWMLAISLGLDRPGLIADAVAPPLRKPRYRRAPPAFASLCSPLSLLVGRVPASRTRFQRGSFLLRSA